MSESKRLINTLFKEFEILERDAREMVFFSGSINKPNIEHVVGYSEQMNMEL